MPCVSNRVHGAIPKLLKRAFVEALHRQLASCNTLATTKKTKTATRNSLKRPRQRKMILTNCAARAAPLAHDAPRCVRCKVRYCNALCGDGKFTPLSPASRCGRKYAAAVTPAIYGGQSTPKEASDTVTRLISDGVVAMEGRLAEPGEVLSGCLFRAAGSASGIAHDSMMMTDAGPQVPSSPITTVKLAWTLVTTASG